MTGPQPRNLPNIKDLLEGKKENKSLVTTRVRQHFHHQKTRIPVGTTGEIPSGTPIIQTESNRKNLEPWNHAAFQNKTGNDARQNNNHQLPVKVSRKHQFSQFKSGIKSKKVFFLGGGGQGCWLRADEEGVYMSGRGAAGHTHAGVCLSCVCTSFSSHHSSSEALLKAPVNAASVGRSGTSLNAPLSP